MSSGMVTSVSADREFAGLARRKDGRLQLTPIYEDPERLADHRDELAPLLVGRSCLRIRGPEEVPAAAVWDVLRRGAHRAV